MVILITGKPRRPQFEPYTEIKMAQVQGFPVYFCGRDQKVSFDYSISAIAGATILSVMYGVRVNRLYTYKLAIANLAKD